MEQLVQKHRWFWAWEDEKEEAWLREMAKSGLHLAKPSPFGLYSFITGQPHDFAYRLDFQPASKNKDRDSYFQIFKDAGWEHVGEMSGWQYFRKEVKDGEVPEIFTDNESKILKYQRLLGYLVIFMPIWIVILVNGSISRVSRYGGTFALIVKLLMFTLICFLGYAVINISRRIRQLKRP